MVQYAYDVGWFDLVKLIECENGRRDTFAIGDYWHAHWLCQANDRFHNIPSEYWQDWKYQINYCNQLKDNGVPFYWPTRMIKWQYCYVYVESRFTFVE